MTVGVDYCNGMKHLSRMAAGISLLLFAWAGYDVYQGKDFFSKEVGMAWAPALQLLCLSWVFNRKHKYAKNFEDSLRESRIRGSAQR